jgi:hypothetical protein
VFYVDKNALRPVAPAPAPAPEKQP